MNEKCGSGAFAPRLLGMALLLLTTPSLAQPPITVEAAWVRAAPPTATVTAGYLTLHNATKAPIRVVGAESPQFERVEIHTSTLHDGVAHMAPVDGVTVPANGSVALAPGGLHLMLIEPRQSFREGDKVIVTLDFADGWSVEFDATVRRDAP